MKKGLNPLQDVSLVKKILVELLYSCGTQSGGSIHEMVHRSLSCSGASLFALASGKVQPPFIASINVVNRCNLHCAGCYWTRTERTEDREELSIEEGVELIHTLWKSGARHFFFVGGEPMTEREKVEQWVRTVARRGGISIIVTNGTYGLPAPKEWPRTRYFISCDGDKYAIATHPAGRFTITTAFVLGLFHLRGRSFQQVKQPG